MNITDKYIITSAYRIAGHRFSVSIDSGAPILNMMTNYQPFACNSNFKDSDNNTGSNNGSNTGSNNGCKTGCITDFSPEDIFSLRINTLTDRSELPFRNDDILKSTDIENDVTFIRHLLLKSGQNVFILCINKETIDNAGYLLISPHSSSAELYIPNYSADMPALRHNIFVVNNALMLLYAYYTSTLSTLLIHASVAVNGDYAQVFLGRSGTGKSTHTRLWLENIPDTWLLNDDNPVIRIMPGGEIRVFGTPWSGKTPCYLNKNSILHGIVRLSQAPNNRITRLKGLKAYATLSPSASAVKWEKDSADGIHSTISDIISQIPVYHLECLPNPDAAQLCHDTLYHNL